jgi:hypothetical protein
MTTRALVHDIHFYSWDVYPTDCKMLGLLTTNRFQPGAHIVIVVAAISLDHIHTTWIWSLVVTPPIAGGPRPALLLAFLLSRGAPKLTFGQHTHYNLLSSKNHQSFPSDLYSTQYLVIFSEFCRFIAVPVIALPPPVSADWKTGFSDLAATIGKHCITRNARDVTDSSRIWNEQNYGWQRHDKTCFLTPAAGS